jgi:hypothetical protein
MEPSILHQIKQRLTDIVDQQVLRHGTVLDVRKWPGSAIIEVDLHLPDSDMRYWNEVLHIKFNVGGLIFRDYTPFDCDAETSTCSLLIDASHDGPGSRCARSLQKNDGVDYLKTDSTRQSPHPTNLVVGLGDNTSLAHLFALQELTLPAVRFDSAVLTDNGQTGKLLSSYFKRPLVPCTSEAELIKWISGQRFCNEHASFYLTGNEGLVILLSALFGFLISKANLQTGSEFFMIPLLLRGPGASLLVVPLTALAVSDLKPGDIPQGAALNNMMRQMGGSFEIALINTYIAHRAAYNRTALITHITGSDAPTAERMHLYIRNFMNHGATYLEATKKALIGLESTVVRQTSLMSI